MSLASKFGDLSSIPEILVEGENQLLKVFMTFTCTHTNTYDKDMQIMNMLPNPTMLPKTLKKRPSLLWPSHNLSGISVATEFIFFCL